MWWATGRGAWSGPFLQARKGLWGGWECRERMNGHANEMLMNPGQDSHESEPLDLSPLPTPAQKEGLPLTPPLLG